MAQINDPLEQTLLYNLYKPRIKRGFFMVRPAGRTYLEVKVLYSPGKGKS